MNIKDLFERKCINAHRAIDRNGRPRAVLYRHPDLYQWAKDSYEKGEEYFYVSHPDPENPYHIVLGEPEYRWFLKNRNGLTDEEYKELLQKSEFAVPKGRPDGCPIKAEITSDTLLKALISEVMTPEQIQEALIINWLNSFNTDSAPKCFEAVQLLKAKVTKGKN